MSVSSGPPSLPPDSPGSSVSSRLQNEYTDLMKRAVILTNHGQTATLTLNPLIIGRGRERMSKKIDAENRSIASNDDQSQSEIAICRDSLSKVPTLNEILSTTPFTTDENENFLDQVLSRDVSDPRINRFVRFSNLLTDEFESKPITEKMDHWYLDMKKNFVNEFEKLRLEFLEEAQQEALREKQAQAKEYIRLNQDIKTMRDMLTHYEETIAEKERNEKNLNKALDHLYNKTVIYRRYYEWRLIHIERHRQQYSFILAKRFYEDKIKRKALNQWKSMAEAGWKKRFETACDKKAKDVLKQLASEYEMKFKQMEFQLSNANEEIERLKIERDEKDEHLKKAFMRGVCALNMEAMSVLLKNPTESDPPIDDENSKEKEKSNDAEQNFVTNSSSEEANRNFSTSNRPTVPVHVYKEFLPNTIYRSGEARPQKNFPQTRQVTFEKRSNQNFSRSRGPTTNVFVERHAPTNRIQS